MILWQGDPLSCVKTFGTRNCKLCAKERYAIIKLTHETPNLAINKCNEVHGACRHKPRFHRFDHSENANSSTDESGRMKGSQRPSSTTSMGSSSSNHTLDSLNNRREEPTLGPSDPASTYLLGKPIPRSTCPLPPYLKGTGPTTGEVQPQRVTTGISSGNSRVYQSVNKSWLG
jgi:hypothetical protein